MSRNKPMPSGFGYVSIPGTLGPDDGEAALAKWTHQLAVLAEQEGYALEGVFTDVRGQSENGLNGLRDVLHSSAAVAAVLAPDLDHLRHTGCLSGAAPPTVARFLGGRLLLATAGAR